MIAKIMKHEWLLIVRDRLVFVTIPIYALLIAYAVYNGANWKTFLDANTTAATVYADRNFADLIAKVEGGEPFMLGRSDITR
jgi:ABC-2 type transport system permease protein